MADVKFIDGLRVYSPNERAPDWVVADIKIDAPELIQWLQKQEDADVRLTVARSQKGNLYAKVNDFRPKASVNSPAPASAQEDPIDSFKGFDDDGKDGLPF